MCVYGSWLLHLILLSSIPRLDTYFTFFFHLKQLETNKKPLLLRNSIRVRHLTSPDLGRFTGCGRDQIKDNTKECFIDCSEFRFRNLWEGLAFSFFSVFACSNGRSCFLFPARCCSSLCLLRYFTWFSPQNTHASSETVMIKRRWWSAFLINSAFTWWDRGNVCVEFLGLFPR